MPAEQRARSRFKTDTDCKEDYVEGAMHPGKPIYIGSRYEDEKKDIHSEIRERQKDIGKHDKNSQNFGCVLYPERRGENWSYNKNMAFMVGAIDARRPVILLTDIDFYRAQKEKDEGGQKKKGKKKKVDMTKQEMAVLQESGYTFAPLKDNPTHTIATPSPLSTTISSTINLYTNKDGQIDDADRQYLISTAEMIGKKVMGERLLSKDHVSLQDAPTSSLPVQQQTSPTSSATGTQQPQTPAMSSSPVQIQAPQNPSPNNAQEGSQASISPANTTPIVITSSSSPNVWEMRQRTAGSSSLSNQANSQSNPSESAGKSSLLTPSATSTTGVNSSNASPPVKKVQAWQGGMPAAILGRPIQSTTTAPSLPPANPATPIIKDSSSNASTSDDQEEGFTKVTGKKRDPKSSGSKTKGQSSTTKSNAQPQLPYGNRGFSAGT